MSNRNCVRFVVFVALSTFAAGVFAQATRSQWDGVYTAEQAARGKALYEDRCAPCHASDLGGHGSDPAGETAPGLIGKDFVVNWNNQSLADLYDRFKTTMPVGAAGSLTQQQYLDILAYVLSKGNYPAGKAEMPDPATELRSYKFLATK